MTITSRRLERYEAAIALAQIILESEDVGQDDYRIEQALQDIRSEVAAGRRNQREWPTHLARALQLIEADGHSGSRKIEEPRLELIQGGAA